ncbi:MAG: OmpA family protein [Pseudomonas sp.]|nr:OmpA family protein [Pseudomonas sp.]
MYDYSKKTAKGIDMEKIGSQRPRDAARMRAWCMLIPMVLVLAGCASLSPGIADDGSSADQLIWPATGDTNAMARDGSYPTPEAVSLLRKGLDKGQVQRLVGAPHFGEGIAGVREWNYLFHLRRADGQGMQTCQLKLLFDRDGQVGSLYWLPLGCGGEESVTATQSVEPPAPTVYTLTAHALFAFDRAALGDMQPEGRQQLEALADQLRDRLDNVQRIDVVAYSDRLGSSSYNQALSTRRARSVAQYLVEAGIPSSRIQATGKGASDALTDHCPASLPRAALIECLEPDRRVEVTVTWIRAEEHMSASNQEVDSTDGSGSDD